MFGKRKSVVGLDIGSSSIKVAEIVRDRGGDRLVNYGISEPLSEAIVDGEIMDRQMVHEAITNLMESRQIRNKQVVTAVSGRAVIVKKILMDKLSEEDAKEAIQWEAEQHVPYDINDVSLDFQIINPNVDAKKMQVLLVAAKKDMIANHADIVREAGLQPMIIDVDSFAIQNAVEANYDFGMGETVALLNIGAEITNLNIIREQVPHFTKDLSVGANSFVEGIQRRHNVSQPEALNALRGRGDGSIDVAGDLRGPLHADRPRGGVPALGRGRGSDRSDPRRGRQRPRPGTHGVPGPSAPSARRGGESGFQADGGLRSVQR